MKMHIIINPEVEIVDKNDRKLYYRMRQILDTCFLNSVAEHVEENNHLYHSCFNAGVMMQQKSLKDFIDIRMQVDTPENTLAQMILNCSGQFTDNLRDLLAMIDECERRGIKFK